MSILSRLTEAEGFAIMFYGGIFAVTVTVLLAIRFIFFR